MTRLMRTAATRAARREVLERPAQNGQDGVGRLAEATRAARDADLALEHMRRQGAERRAIRAIDVLLDELERVNLGGGATTESPRVIRWLARVETEVGITVPAWVAAVPDTVRLHATILRWQGVLLDEWRPERGHIGDMHEDPLDLLLIPGAALGRMRGGRPRVRRRVA
jgi:hypothetical protein